MSTHRLRAFLAWHLRLKGRMRRALYFHDPAKVAVGDRLTLMTPRGPIQAEIVRIDQWGSARLVGEDGETYQRVVA